MESYFRFSFCTLAFSRALCQKYAIKIITCVEGVPLLAYRWALPLPQSLATWWHLGSTTMLLGFSCGWTNNARSAVTSVVVATGGYFALLRRCLLGRTRPRVGAWACLRASLLRMNPRAWIQVHSEHETHWNWQFIQTRQCQMNIVAETPIIYIIGWEQKYVLLGTNEQDCSVATAMMLAFNTAISSLACRG